MEKTVHATLYIYMHNYTCNIYINIYIYIHKHSVNNINTSHNNYKHCHNLNSVKNKLLLRHIHTCHTSVSTQCLPHGFNHLHWKTPQVNNSNKRAPSQSSSEGVYCSLSLSGLDIEPQMHLPHLSSGNCFFCLLPICFTEVILDKERAWKKQITLPHTGLLYQCSMSQCY